ncbi:uncharacterized protein C10orf67 homolog, mitochondrial isoform X2 [Polypterus senegalus]|uniref:uncharacterized protein C10orf67 homolog, mitochondrial isoform X2 n=1 Tax=Polypterus senegalus TaxID=55291 RepID=UPI00196693E7|nr:uncharacterized protein C10orf67 homolog, mitochondrial isoform X2 [Polypterus senegalus]
MNVHGEFGSDWPGDPEWTEESYLRDVQELTRYSLSDQLRCGHFGMDSCCQTDVNEILPLKELTEVIYTLMKEVDFLKRDVQVQHTFFQTDYESKLQQESEGLHRRLNDRIQDLERQHTEKAEILRKSCRQQLCDALAVLRASYEKFLTKTQGKRQEPAPQPSWNIKDFLDELQRKDAVIESLNSQLSDLEKAVPQLIFEPEDDPEKERLEEENDALKNELSALRADMEGLRDAVELKEQQIKSQGRDLKDMKEAREREEGRLNKLTQECEMLKRQLQEERNESCTLLMKQKEEMETKLGDLVNASRQQMLAQKEKSEKRFAEMEDQHRLLAEEETKKTAARSVMADQNLQQRLEFVLKTNKEQEKEIESLRKQLERINLMWDKKFAVLKQSFYAIKDEMFLRQTLQRQAATLHQASINYMFDSPGVTRALNTEQDASKGIFSTPAPPLPNIGSRFIPGNEPTHQENVIRIPTGRGVDAASAAEYHLSSDEEDDAADDEEQEVMLPFPAPSPHSQEAPGLSAH